MKNLITQLSLASTLLVISSPLVEGRILAAQAKSATPPRSTQNSAAPYSFEDYKKECLQRSKKEGLPEVDAEKLCSCTINQFRSRYSLQQFKAIVQKSKTDKAAQKSLSAVGETCFEKVLYEE